MKKGPFSFFNYFVPFLFFNFPLPFLSLCHFVPLFKGFPWHLLVHLTIQMRVGVRFITIYASV